MQIRENKKREKRIGTHQTSPICPSFTSKQQLLHQRVFNFRYKVTHRVLITNGQFKGAAKPFSWNEGLLFTTDFGPLFHTAFSPDSTAIFDSPVKADLESLFTTSFRALRPVPAPAACKSLAYLVLSSEDSSLLFLANNLHTSGNEALTVWMADVMQKLRWRGPIARRFDLDGALQTR